VNLYFSVVSLLDDEISFKMLIPVTRAQHELANMKRYFSTFDANIPSDQKHLFDRMEQDCLLQPAFH
jgi:hypothetical protein